jgi:hypothetical protein
LVSVLKTGEKSFLNKKTEVVYPLLVFRKNVGNVSFIA